MDKMQNEEPRCCPTQSGTFTGYRTEWRMTKCDVSSDWKLVEIKEVEGYGVPYPSQFRGILHTIGMSGHHQAMALGHIFAANLEASGGDGIEIRAVPYAISYDIKAKKLDSF